MDYFLQVNCEKYKNNSLSQWPRAALKRIWLAPPRWAHVSNASTSTSNLSSSCAYRNSAMRTDAHYSYMGYCYVYKYPNVNCAIVCCVSRYGPALSYAHSAEGFTFPGSTSHKYHPGGRFGDCCVWWWECGNWCTDRRWIWGNVVHVCTAAAARKTSFCSLAAISKSRVSKCILKWKRRK